MGALQMGSHQREESVQQKGGVALHELGVGLLESLRPDGLLDVPQVRVEDGHQALVYQGSGKKTRDDKIGRNRRAVRIPFALV